MQDVILSEFNHTNYMINQVNNYQLYNKSVKKAYLGRLGKGEEEEEESVSVRLPNSRINP